MRHLTRLFLQEHLPEEIMYDIVEIKAVLEIIPEDVAEQTIKGFLIVFMNGRVVSAQAGFGNYCSNKTYDISLINQLMSGEVKRYWWQEAVDFEVATWAGKEFRMSEIIPGDTVAGNVSFDELIRLIKKLWELDKLYGEPCVDMQLWKKLGEWLND